MTEQQTDGQDISIASNFLKLVESTSRAATTLVESGEYDAATVELLRSVNTGLLGLIMLAEGQLNATTALVNLVADRD